MMDYTDSNNLSAMTDNEIKEAIEALTNECCYRKQQKKAKLIKDFQQAFNALKSAGVGITYCDGDEDIELALFWDGFNFD